MLEALPHLRYNQHHSHEMVQRERQNLARLIEHRNLARQHFKENPSAESAEGAREAQDLCEYALARIREWEAN